MTTTHQRSRRPGTRPADRIARWITEGLSPAILSATTVVIVGATSGASAWTGVGWALVVLLFVCLIPYLVIVVGVRRGRYTDHHLRDVRQRPAPLAFGLVSAAVGLLLVDLGGGPRSLIALVAASVAGFAVLVAVSLRWKMSVHSGVAAGGTAIVGIIGGAVAWLVGLVVVGSVAWSRVRLRDHTVAQVVVGAVVGAIVAGTVFGFLK